MILIIFLAYSTLATGFAISNTPNPVIKQAVERTLGTTIPQVRAEVYDHYHESSHGKYFADRQDVTKTEISFKNNKKDAVTLYKALGSETYKFGKNGERKLDFKEELITYEDTGYTKILDSMNIPRLVELARGFLDADKLSMSISRVIRVNEGGYKEDSGLLRIKVTGETKTQKFFSGRFIGEKKPIGLEMTFHIENAAIPEKRRYVMSLDYVKFDNKKIELKDEKDRRLVFVLNENDLALLTEDFSNLRLNMGRVQKDPLNKDRQIRLVGITDILAPIKMPEPVEYNEKVLAIDDPKLHANAKQTEVQDLVLKGSLFTSVIGIALLAVIQAVDDSKHSNPKDPQ